MRLTKLKALTLKALKLKALAICGLFLFPVGQLQSTLNAQEKYNAVTEARKRIDAMKVGKRDWPQWGGSYLRNNVTDEPNIVTDWNVKDGKNVRWSMPLGSETYGNPVVANGKVFVGTNNGNGYIKRYPNTIDLGCLVCFDEKDGKFLWQHSSEKLSTGRVHDWPHQGICCAPMIDGDRLWYVTSRGEVVCLDTEGFNDDENDGAIKDEPNSDKTEADVVWRMNMMKELGVSQHNMCSCSVTAVGNKLFVNTSNGVDEGHVSLPAPAAPSFICLDRDSGKLLWADNSPGANVLHGQWSSPTAT